MKKEKVSQILTGVIIAVLGVLIAIFGAETVLDTYFGIVACVSGGILLLVAIYLVAKKGTVPASTFVYGSVLLAIGISLFTNWLTVGVLINLLVIVILGIGAGLILFGVYKLANKETVFGIVNIVMGVIALTLAILYIAVPDFRKAFWIIVGIAVAIYGVVQAVLAIVKKK